jgi:hypothetical protein
MGPNGRPCGFTQHMDGVRIGEVWWSEQNEEDTMRVGVAVVLALAIAALATRYRERPHPAEAQREMRSQRGYPTI